MSNYLIKSEKQAAAAAKKLAKLMGAGWKPRVWENLGWHYSASWGNLITVYPIRYRVSDKTSYHCLLSDTKREHFQGGSMLWPNNTKSFTCPKKCVAAQIKRAKKVVEGLNQIIEEVENCI